ncbi:unnamed protein product [Ectocarpus sp. CCAP 1310/34]|nr:unnamed protein product [Ectocarpus sp. CCAP 1310/34]
MIRSPLAGGEESITLARRWFLYGCAGLPLLWIVSCFFFRDKLRDIPTEARKWVLLSFAAGGVSTTLCVAWVVTSLSSWKSWGTAVMVSVPDSDLTGW